MSVLSAGARRAQIKALLETGSAPVSATALAGQFSVSRQIIVGDVALLRAGGADIFATPRGYVAAGAAAEGILRVVACVHSKAEMGRELTTIVDAGSEVVDVVVEHPVYGQLTGALHIRSRYDVSEFLRRVEEHGARPLSDLTVGIHLHTLRAPDEETCRRTLAALRHNGFLLETSVREGAN